MIIKFSCQNCRQELSKEEVELNRCCPKCGKFLLKVNRTVKSEPQEKLDSKTAFVKMLYSNVKTQKTRLVENVIDASNFISKNH